MAEKVTLSNDTVTRKHVELYEHFGCNLLEESVIEGTRITVRAFPKPFS